MLFDAETLKGPVKPPPSICVRMRPTPPLTNGRTPAPCVPPIGTPTMTLPIRSMTLLLPKSLFVPKKLGLQPKSTSPSMTPAPMAPALTQKPTRPLSKLLPPFADTHGLTNPSARATDGAEMAATAAATIRALITHRMMFLLLLWPEHYHWPRHYAPGASRCKRCTL